MLEAKLALDKKEYALGDPITATVTLTNTGKKELATSKPELALPSCYFTLEREDKTRSAIVKVRSASQTITIKPGESVSAQIELLAIEPGTFEITAWIGGSDWRFDTSKPTGTRTNSEKLKVKPATKDARIKARITTELGDMVASFFPDRAYNHVHSFLTLARAGFYDGIAFHRVVPRFVIQGGCPDGNGTGGPGYKLPQEFNSTRHVPGILSMARTADPNSAGSQIFVCTAVTPHLDNQYTVFGQVESGADVYGSIGASEANAGRYHFKKITVFVE